MDDLIARLKDALKPCPKVEPAVDGQRPAAVLVPLYREDGHWGVLFTKRTDKVEKHKSQVSFPGGAVDPEDDNLLATALRETFEEVGVAPDDVTVLGSLPPTQTITNYLVYPFVGVIPYPYSFHLNSFEVDSLVQVPLEQLLDEAREQPAATLSGWNLTFNRQGEIIWGATARMLYQFLDAALLGPAGEEGGSR